MYQKSYHNTLNLPDTSVKETKCQTQEEYILGIFQASEQGLTAAEVWEMIIHAKMDQLSRLSLIEALKRGREINSSVRRAITNLANRGYLVKGTAIRDGNTEYLLI